MKEFLIDIPYKNTAIDIGDITGLVVKMSTSCRSKSISLKIDFAGNCIVLTYPIFASERSAIDFLLSKQDWVYMNFAKKKSKENTAKSDFNLQIVEGGVVSVCGRALTVIRDENAVGVRIVDDNIIVSGAEDFLERRVKDFAKKEFLKYIKDYIKKCMPDFQKRISRISLKDTTSRWGSCSSGGNLSFSYRVAFAPKFVIDYLIVHELCHLKEMNHGNNFWKMVEKFIVDADIRRAKNWLNKNGFLLHSL